MEIPNVISIDVEDWFQVENFASVISPTTWDTHKLRVAENVEWILDTLAAYKARGTFFTLGWLAERAPGLIQKIAAKGHEIASHGWSHTPIWRLTRAQFLQEITRSRALLRQLSGQAVLGYRAPTFSITKDTIWALDVLSEAGYFYDSSIFPIHHDRYGIPDAPLHIHQHASGIWEVPLSVYELGSLRVPFAGGGYFRLYPRMLTNLLIHKINKQGRPAIMYVHPWEFDPAQPRVPGINAILSFRHYVGIGRNRNKFKWLLSHFSFGRIQDVLQAMGVELGTKG